MTPTTAFIRSILCCLLALTLGCETAPTTPTERNILHEQVQATIKEMQQADPTLSKFFDSAQGYAVFPSVGKGAVGVGGAYGKGEVYEKGKLIGYCDVSQGTVGLQLGGQAYMEVVFFQSEAALKEFTTGEFALAAQASAVAVKAGGAATADYEKGVAVFTMPKGGLMFEASVGGQQFDFEPLK